MQWISLNSNSSRQFCQMVNTDPDMAFVEETVGTRRRMLTLSTVAEIDEFPVVVAADRSWRVHISREGRKLVPMPVRISKARSKR